jgi:tetratricopeptide (TPR) repeat protein
MASYEGRLADARELFRSTAELASRRGFQDVAAGYASQAAWLELFFGRPEEAVRLAREVLSMRPSETQKVRAAVTLALTGNVEAAEAIVHELERSRPDATFTKGVFLPLAEGAVEIARRHYDEAVEHLRAARPYELGTIAALAPIYLRAEAFRRAARYEEAAREYERILSNRGVDPFSMFHPLSRLGLARAAAARGDRARARERYGEFFSAWADADEDIALLREAREEFRRLNPES